MKVNNAIRNFFVLALLILVIEGKGQQKTPFRYDFSYLHSKIQQWVDSGYYDGASLIVIKDHHVIDQRCFGTYQPGTVTFVASAGKWLAAATIAAVVDEGKLHWTDEVRKWLPEFTDVKGRATLAQLLSHTSGYPDYQPAGQPTDLYQTLEASVAHIVRLPADTLPGARFTYGGLSMQVAGRMAELATGKDWETLFQEKIARPLGMQSTHFTPVDSSGGHAPMLGGGARTTLDDYACFLSMVAAGGVYKGRRILSVASIRTMQADQVGNARVSRGSFVDQVRARSGSDVYGLGEWREEVDSQGQATLISSPSWAGAYPWIDKKNNVCGFFMTHVKRARNGFNPFLSSPVIAVYVRDAITDSRHPEVKRGYVDVDSGRLYYEELGQGEPLIFIHGHSFDHYEWDPQFYTFAKHYRVIRYDVRGYGRSSMPQEFSPILHADDLARLMDGLKITKAHLVGLSMGGFITLDMVVQHPERVLSAVLASGDLWMGAPGPGVPWSDALVTKARSEIAARETLGIQHEKRQWLDALTIREGKEIASIREPVWNMIYRWDAWQLLHVEPRYLLGASVVDRLRQTPVKVPVLVLTGSVDAHGKNKIMELIPSAKQVFVPDAGHVSNLENAAGFNRAVNAFLDSLKRDQFRNFMKLHYHHE